MKISYDRLVEIATNALHYINDNDNFADFESEYWLDLDESEKEFFGIEEEEDDEMQ